jgi:MGT family glycosyltransferase
VSRFLFVVPPLTGHINPTVSVGDELASRGHDVAWAGHPATLRRLLPGDARVFEAMSDDFDARLQAQRERWLTLRGAAALEFFWETFAHPLGHEMMPGTTKAITHFAPDVVVTDQQAMAGAVAALKAGLPWVTSASTPGEFLRPLAGIPKVDEWIRDQISAFQQACGIVDPVDLRFSGQLILVFTTAALVGNLSGLDDRYVFAGPALTGRPDRGTFPWEWLDPERRHVLVSLGTLNAAGGERFFRVVIDALSGLGGELQAIVVAPAAPPSGQVPPNVLFTEHVPQLALLPHLSAVVSHGGYNTVCETLAHGLPLVVAPIRDDQPLNAQLVADAGAGVRVRFARLRAPELEAALRAVLDDPRYGAAARRIRDSFIAAGGAVTAANHLEKLA